MWVNVLNKQRGFYATQHCFGTHSLFHSHCWIVYYIFFRYHFKYLMNSIESCLPRGYTTSSSIYFCIIFAPDTHFSVHPLNKIKTIETNLSKPCSSWLHYFSISFVTRFYQTYAISIYICWWTIFSNSSAENILNVNKINKLY